MWISIFIGQSKQIALDIKELLETKNIISKFKVVGEDDLGNNALFEIFVPESEVQHAHRVLIENGF